VPMVAVQGALAGMGFTPGVNYAEGADLDSMVDAARSLVNDFGQLNRLQEAAFQHCQGRFDWSQRAGDLHAFAGRLADARKGAVQIPPSHMVQAHGRVS